MAKKHAGKEAREAEVKKQKEWNDEQSAMMEFPEPQFLHPLDLVPLYEPGKVYEIKGAASVHYWELRGANIVSGNISYPEPESNPSEIVPNEFTEQKPFGGNDKDEPVANDKEPSDSDENEIQLDSEE